MPYPTSDGNHSDHESEPHAQQPTVYPWEEEAPGDDKGSLALAGGIVTAIVGGLIWAAIVIFVNLEVGWVAWGVGAAVGLVMGHITVNRSRNLALTAAGLAAAGLLVGKLVITWSSAGPIADELYANPDFLEGVVAWQMYDEQAFEPSLQAELLATIQAGDTLSDATWEEMKRQATATIGDTDERRRLAARAAADRYVSQLGILGGIGVQLRAWDLLWFGLAVFTAYGMMNARKEEVAGEVESTRAAA